MTRTLKAKLDLDSYHLIIPKPNHFYKLKIAEFKQGTKYELKYQIEPIKGGASGVITLIPALEPDAYAPERGPDTDANEYNKKQPDEL